jgi:hypothetical protein
VLAVQDTTMQLILEAPTPSRADGPPSPLPEVTVSTDRNEPLRWRGSTGLGIGGIGGQYLYVLVFELPPPGTEVLHVLVKVGDMTALAVRLYPLRTSIGP